MLHYIVTNRLILLFTTAILGCHFSTRRDDHVILCSTFKLFEHQTVRSSRVHCTLLTRAATASSVGVSYTYIVRYTLTALAAAVLTVISLVVSSSTDGHH
jgi:hypothetical protein